MSRPVDQSMQSLKPDQGASKANSTQGQLLRWLLFSEWRAHPLRTAIAVLAIALGVALGYAIELINGAAFNEFSAAARSLSGQADLQLRGHGPTFDESIYPWLAERPGVALASPVLEVDASLPQGLERGALKTIGIDVFRAGEISPDTIGVPAADHGFDTLMDDAIVLSPAAMQWLNRKAGDTLALRSGTGIATLRVAGTLLHARAGQRLAVMDIGAAQWRFNRVGQLSRIDIKLEAGVDRAAFRRALQDALQRLPGRGDLLVGEPEEQEARTANLSRAYRVNLSVLALVALFTGAFLVFSTQALAVLRRRQQFALLRVLGLSRRSLLVQVLVESGMVGVVGALLGLAGGYAIAGITLKLFGGDLGGGYFPGVQPSVQFSLVPALLFFVAGVGIALAGGASPAWDAARSRPAEALKSGSEEVALTRLSAPWPALVCLALGAMVSQLPPVGGLPVFGYAAVALLLVGGIALMPRFTALVFSAPGRRRQSGKSVSARHGAVQMLTLARLANAPNQAAIALGGVLSSFSLMVAMAIMVASFRVSVDDWLGRVLSADLYVRSSTFGDTATLDADAQSRIAAIPGVARVEFLRARGLTLDPNRPAVTLIARPISLDDPGRTLPLAGEQLATAQLVQSALAGVAPIWVSEAMVDVYGYRVGQRVTLPVGATPRTFLVAGIWRDYARQSGSIQMRREDYVASTGDREVNDAALWLLPAANLDRVSAALRALPFGAGLQLAGPGSIRAASLKIFDRSFAITYLLEGVAIVIGLFGIAATFSSQTLSRAREFGMLRHIGLSRRQILMMLGLEGGLLTLAGIAVGFLLGWCISLILVFVVNPQSFHWTMQMHIPWSMLGQVALLLLASSATTALLAGRRAVSGDVVRSVREDW
jgi:putative ABC transport system permease protein